MRGGRSCSCSLGGSGGSQAGTAQGVPAICGLTPTEGRAEPAAAWDLVTCMRTHPISALTGAWSRACAPTPNHGTYWGLVTCVCLHTPSWHLLGPGHVCVLTHPIMALTGARLVMCVLTHPIMALIGAGHSASSEDPLYQRSQPPQWLFLLPASPQERRHVGCRAGTSPGPPTGAEYALGCPPWGRPPECPARPPCVSKRGDGCSEGPTVLGWEGSLLGPRSFGGCNSSPRLPEPKTGPAGPAPPHWASFSLHPSRRLYLFFMNS